MSQAIAAPIGTGANEAERPDFGDFTIPFFFGMVIGLAGTVYGFMFGCYLYLLLGVLAERVKMFIVTGFLHRYFSHETFHFTKQKYESVAGVLCLTTWQRTPVRWGIDHRRHHQYSDRKENDGSSKDPHSFWIAYDYQRSIGRGRIKAFREAFNWSHVGWVVSKNHVTYALDLQAQRQLENPWLNYIQNNPLFLIVPPLCEALMFASVGILWGWITGRGIFINMVLSVFVGYMSGVFWLWMWTFCINSLAHFVGKKRYITPTNDHSGNSIPLALGTHGEGFHNNHHKYQKNANQGILWWELLFDPTFVALCILQKLGVTERMQMGVRKESLAFAQKNWLTRDCNFFIVGEWEVK